MNLHKIFNCTDFKTENKGNENISQAIYSEKKKMSNGRHSSF